MFPDELKVGLNKKKIFNGINDGFSGFQFPQQPNHSFFLSFTFFFSACITQSIRIMNTTVYARPNHTSGNDFDASINNYWRTQNI